MADLCDCSRWLTGIVVGSDFETCPLGSSQGFHSTTQAFSEDARSEEVQFVRAGDRLGSVVDAELAVGIRDMALDC